MEHIEQMEQIERIEHKIRKLLIKLTGAGIGAVILVSAVSILFMRSTSISTNERMNQQSITSCENILTEEMNAQVKQYTASCGKIIDKQFGQTALSLKVIAGGISSIYDQPDLYIPVEYKNAKDITGTGKQMHWLLPQGMEFSGEMREEICRLGNILPYFRSFSLNNSRIQHIFFTSGSGVNVGYDADYDKKPPVFEGRVRGWYKDAVSQGKMAVSEVYADSFLGQMIVTFSMPCYGDDGALLGVLAADLLIDDLFKMVNELSLEFGGYAMLVSRGGNMVAAPGLTLENADDLEYFLGDEKEKILGDMKDRVSNVTNSTVQGREKYVIYSDVETTGWNICIVLDRSSFAKAAEQGSLALKETMKEARKDSTRQLMLTCVLWGLSVLFVVVLVPWGSRRMAGRISRPIEQLTEDIRNVGEGNLSYVSDIHTNDEIEVLSRAFAGMTDSLGRYIGDLSRLTAEKERLATELHVATQIQVSMLPCIFPAFPERSEIDIYASMHPAKEVGGDFYDFFLTDEDHLCIVMADVSGKGIPAALFMVVAKTLLKDNLTSSGQLGDVFAWVNNQLCQNNEAGMFVTAFAACMDLTTGRLDYVNAGHNPPVWINRSRGPVWVDKPSGFVLAGLSHMEYEEGSIELEPGDVLYAYTDGVTEAVDESLKLYGNKRLMETLEGYVCGEGITKAEVLVENMTEQLHVFMGGAQQADDITMLALCYRPGGDASYRQSIELAADTKELDKLREFVDAQIERYSSLEKIRQKVQLAAEELFVNVADYAYPDRKDRGRGSVLVRCETQKDRFTFTIEDSGIAYNPLEQAAPDLAGGALDRQVGGLGVYLVRENADQICYKREDGKNILTFVMMGTGYF